MRYAAFISYNHRDRRAAAWLHRALEMYRIPPKLHGRDSPVGVLGARLPPVFQDREELAASSDLATSVREALAEAASLIVVCSPAGAASRWVNEEIRAFTALGRRDRIQCLIVGGEPNASRLPGRDPALECLPPALFENGGAEPLAADIRPGQDSRAAAKLKLLAGVMGVSYDELRQREAARRQRRLATVAAASGLGFVGMSALATYAMIARQDAIEQRDLARRKTITAERTVDFVQSMFEVADPSESRGRTVTAREILDKGAARIDRELVGEPSVRAALGTTVGETYTGLGLLRQGDALIRRMLLLPGVDPGTRVRQFVALGGVREAQGDDDGAARAFSRALRLAHDPRSGRADLIPRILIGLGDAQTGLGELAAGERDIRAALALDRIHGASRPVDLARDLEALGSNLVAAGQLAAARGPLSEALRIRLTAQGELHPLSIRDMNQLGAVAYLGGDSATAERYARAVLRLRAKVLGPDHPDVGGALNNYARLLIERGDYTAAAPLMRRAVAIQAAQRSADASDLAFYDANLGIALVGTGHAAEARGYFEKALAVAIAHQHRNRAPILGEFADLLCAEGQTARGRALVAEARPIMAKDYPKDLWRSAWLESVDARCLLAMGRRDEAARLLAGNAPIVLKRWPVSSRYGAYVKGLSDEARRDRP